MPLHNICGNKSASLEMLNMVLNAWPDAARGEDWHRCAPLHNICGNKSISLEMLNMVLKAYPEATREEDSYGINPLHNICRNKSTSLEMLSIVLNAWPEAAREEDSKSCTPLHNISANKSASYRMIQVIVDEWLNTKENRTSHCAIFMISPVEHSVEGEYLWDLVIRDDMKELFCHLSSLFEENNQINQFPQDIMTYFINTSWWNGVWLAISRHPSIAKSMKLQTTVMADFLFTAGKCLSLASMVEVIRNEPDLLEGAWFSCMYCINGPWVVIQLLLLN